MKTAHADRQPRRYRLPTIALGVLTALGPTSAVANCVVSKLAELPVTMSGSMPIVTAKVNGTEARFLADSGAFYSIISPGGAAALGLSLQQTRADLNVTGVGGSSQTWITTVRDFRLGDIPLRNLTFLVGGSETGQTGVIGQNVWGVTDVEYDLPHGVIRMMRPQGCGGANLAYWAGDRTFSVVTLDHGPGNPEATVGLVKINGVPIHATFDTGASQSMLSLAAAAQLGIRPDNPGVIAAGEANGLGRNTPRTWIAPIESFDTNGERIEHLHMLIGDLPPGIDMLIGADFFIAHRVYVANSLYRLFFTYEGGPVFNTRATYRDERAGDGAKAVAVETSGPEPTDADGFSRRGAVFLSQRNLPRAVADLTRAVTLAPDDPRYLRQRAAAYAASGQPKLALADLDTALTHKPDDLAALLDRAAMRAQAYDKTGATADLDAADKAASKSANERFWMADLYNAVDRPDAAIAQFDLWIAAHPDDSRRPQALNGRCWNRALAGKDLEKALNDCTAALHARPKDATILDSRGLVRLRLADYAAAITDYDAALAIDPRIAWSLYGRGVAEHRQGHAALGKADINAATTIDPALLERARLYAIVP